MKKLLLIFLCLAMIFSMVACKGSKDNADISTQPSTTVTTTPTTMAPTESTGNSTAPVTEPTTSEIQPTEPATAPTESVPQPSESATTPTESVHVHRYDSGTVTQAATCTEDGVKTYACSGCEQTSSLVIPATGHSYALGICSACQKPESIPNSLFPLEEPVTFRMAVQGDKNYQELMEKCQWYQLLCDRTNVFIECVALGSDYANNLSTLIATGKSPDVVLGPDTLTSPQVNLLADQGLLLPLEDYITNPEIMPNYQRLLKAVPQAVDNMTAPDGHIWSVAGISSRPQEAWESPLSVNMDWLKQVPGYEDGNTFPKTVEEFTEVLRYFKSNDMNRNRRKDEIPLLMVSSCQSGDSRATLQGLMNLWGLSTTDSDHDYYVHIASNNKLTLAPCTDAYRDCLKWVNIWYEEGLVWNKFLSNVSAEELAAVSGSKTPVWGFFNGDAWYNNGPDLKNTAQPWGDAQTLADPFATGYGVSYRLNPGVNGSLNHFTVFRSCEKPEILLAWYDQFLSFEGALYAGNGISEKDHSHTWDSIFDLNPVFTGISPEEYTNSLWSEQENPGSVVRSKWIEEHPDYFDHSIWTRPYSTADEADYLPWLWHDVKQVIRYYETAFITGRIELNDAAWNEFQEELKDAGGTQLIEILQIMWNRRLER